MQNDIFEIEVPQKEIIISKSQLVKDKIVFYGDNNDYPNKFDELINSSETAKACVGALTKFLATEFEDKNIGKTVVGKTITNKNYTLNQFVKDIAKSLATFNGAYIAVQKNLLNQTAEVSVLDFTKVRFSEFDDLGHSNYVYVGDWNNEITGKKLKKSFAKYPLYNDNDEIFKHQAEELGTTTQVYHLFFDTRYVYPCNLFEQCAYDMGTEREIQVNRYEEITQGTPAKLIIRTDFSNDKFEKQEQIESIKNFAGSKGQRVLVIRSSFDEAGVPISNGYQLDTVPDTRDLNSFSDAEKACANNIRKATGLPLILIDYESATGINVSGEQMRMSVNYFDELVKEDRKMITEMLEEIFSNTNIPFESKNFNLTKKTIDY